MSESVKVAKLPECDLCIMEAINDDSTIELAQYDARTKYGRWGYLCQRHFDEDGPGQLGTGHGQRLIVEGETP